MKIPTLLATLVAVVCAAIIVTALTFPSALAAGGAYQATAYPTPSALTVAYRQPPTLAFPPPTNTPRVTATPTPGARIRYVRIEIIVCFVGEECPLEEETP